MGRKGKQTVWSVVDYTAMAGYNNFALAATVTEQKEAFFAIKDLNTTVKEVSFDTHKQKKKYITEIYQRFLIDMTKGLVPTLDNAFFSVLASNELLTIVEGIVKKNMKLSVVQGMTEDRINHIIQDVFLYVCTKFDPLSMDCTLATFIFRNQKRFLGNELSSEIDGQTEATMKIDATVKRLMSELEKQKREPSISNIVRLARENKNISEIDDSKAGNESMEINGLTAAKVKFALMRIERKEKQCKIYAEGESGLIDIPIQSDCREMKNPESLYLENEQTERILSAMRKINDAGQSSDLQIYLDAMGFSINGDKIQDCTPKKVDDIAKTFDKSVSEVKQIVRHVQSQLAQEIHLNKDDAAPICWVDKILEKNKVPFVKATKQDQEELDDFDSIIELSDF